MHSHRWPQRFKAISPDYVASLIDDDMEDIPDINANPDQYDLVDWDMEPGDILAFHPLTLHGSYGNASRTRRRRALARCAAHVVAAMGAMRSRETGFDFGHFGGT